MSQAIQSARRNSQREDPTSGAASKAESIEAHRKLSWKIKRTANKRNLQVAVLGVICVLVGAAAYPLHSPELFWCAIAAFVFLAFFLKDPARWLTEDEYYELPHSKQNGEHRCIFCWGRGIYRRGEYKTTKTYAACSKCKHELFRES